MVARRSMPHDLIPLGDEAHGEGRLEEARLFFSLSVRAAREGVDRGALTTSLIGLGKVERDLKNNRAAIQCYREAVELCSRGPQRLAFADTLRHFADLLREDKAIAEA